MSIEIVRLTKSFGGRTVLRDVTLTVERGRVLFVIGTSGTGKSVLMKHVVGLLAPDAGEVRVDGVRVDPRSERRLQEIRRRCGFVFQHPTLLDHLTLEENVALPLRVRRRVRRRAALEQARHWLARVGLDGEAARRPAELAEGVRKRAAVARALAVEPDYLIYDEPTTGLDPVNARRVDALVRDLADRTGVTSVVVSHDLKSIFGVADRIAFLYGGRVHLEGDREDFERSGDPVVRQFVAGAADGPIPG